MKGGRQIVGKRAVLLAAGIFLLAQAGLFFLGGENPFAEFGILALFAWGGLSTALGAVLAIAALSGRAWREGDDLKSVNGPGPLLPPPDYSFNLPTVCSLLQEGLVLLRQEKIVYANQSFAYLLGVQEDELTGTSFHSFVHPDDLPQFTAHFSQPFSRQGSFAPAPDDDAERTAFARSTIRLITALGDSRWVVCNMFTVYLDGEAHGLLTLEHIGPLKQAQRSLERHELQSRILLEKTPLGVALFDALGHLTVYNSLWHSTWGQHLGGLGQGFNILQDPFVGGPEVAQAVREAFAKNESRVDSLEHVSAWGETRWYSMGFHPMLTPIGNLIGVLMIQRDITDSTRSERRENELNEQLGALRREFFTYQDRTGRLLELIPEAVAGFNEKRLVTLWNKRAENLFGLEARFALGRNVESLAASFGPCHELLQRMWEEGAESAQATVQMSGRDWRATAHILGSGPGAASVLRVRPLR